MTGWKFLSVFLLSLVLWSSIAEAQSSSFREACDDTVKCDKKAWLTCQNGTCGCMKPDIMMYEESTGKCASKAGERCKFIIQEFDNNDVIFEMISCIQNSKCNGEGFCICDSKFYEDLNGTCSTAQSHMETCDSQVKCSAYQALQCTDGQCKCNESVSKYYSTGASSARQCVGLAGESCINSKCVESATCSSETLCVCYDGFYKDVDKRCVQKVKPLGVCTKDEQCLNITGFQLICVDGLCNCDPTYSRYGTSQRLRQHDFVYYISYTYEGSPETQCLGLAGSPCLDGLCVDNSYCDFKNKNYNPGTCTCKDDYTRSKTGTCPSFYAGNCTLADTCVDGLVCKESKCRCPFNDQDFDSSTQKCVSKVDGSCNSSSSCVPNAECKLFAVFPVESGHCFCKNGYLKTPEGKCTPKFGQTCVSAADCDSVSALMCTNQICQCDDFAKYSEKYRKCLGLVGASCDLSLSEFEPQCVENSKCERVHPRLQRVCTCPTVFKETPQYTCELANQVVNSSTFSLASQV